MKVSTADYLKGRLRTYGLTYQAASKACGMARSTFVDKVNNPTTFRIFEFNALAKILEIQPDVYEQLIKGEEIEI